MTVKLPITDFANFAPLPALIRHAEIKHFNSYIPKINYWPLRAISSRLFNISAFSHFGDREDFSILVERIIELSRRKDPELRAQQIKLNLRALRAIYDFCSEHEVYGVSDEFGSYLYTIEGGIKPYLDCVLYIEGRPHIVFPDMRGSKYLSPEGRKFVFSVMHHHIRERFSDDLANVELAILHLEKNGKKKRKVRIIAAGNQKLFSLQELDEMVSSLFYELREAA